MAQQKLHCALQRTHGNNQKDSGEGQVYSSRKSLAQNKFRISSETCEVSSHDWTSFDQRLESDGNWKVYALPMRCFDQPNHMAPGAQINMNGLCQFSPQSRNAFNANQLKLQKGRQSHLPHSIKPYATRNFSGSSIQHQSPHNIFVKKVAGSNEFSDCSSWQSSATCNDSYNVISKGYSTIRSPDVIIDGSNIDKAVKKKYRKKARRKGKQNKNITSDTVSVDPRGLSEYANASTASDTCGYKDHGDEQGSYATSPEVSSTDSSIGKTDLELKTSTSNIDEVVILERNINSMIGNHSECVTDGAMEKANHRQISSCGNMHSKAFLDMPDSLALDSVSVGSNSTGSADASQHTKLYDKERSSISFSEMQMADSTKEYVSHKSVLGTVTPAYNHVEGSKCGRQNSSYCDVQLLVSGKRGKKLKELPKRSGGHKLGNCGDLHGRKEKENNHSVWQKVRRNDVDACNCELKKVPICSQFDTTLKQAPPVKRNADIVVVNTLSRTEEDMKRQKDKVPKKLKKKNNLGLKHEYNCYSERGSCTSTATSNARRNNSMQQNEISGTSAQVNDKKVIKSASRCYSQKGSPRDGFQSSRGECVNSESFYSAKVFPVAFEPPEDTCDTASSLRIHPTESQDSSLPKLCDSLDQTLLGLRPPVYLPHLLGNRFSQIEKEFNLVDCCKQNHSSGSVLQKWIPIGVKGFDLTTPASFENSSLHLSDGSAGEDCAWRNNIEEKGASDSQFAVSPLTFAVDLCSGNTNCFSHADDHNQNSMNQTAWMVECNSKLVRADCRSSESKEKKVSAFEADSKKIDQAVNNACRIRLASVAVQIATGGPIAEFEKVLHLCSPVIRQSHSLLSSQACPRDEVVGLLKSGNERPNISLECLWKWYEKHGSYGLEVKAEDYENLKRIGVDRFSFRAYFVPFLSAVQLFKDHRSQLTTLKNEPCASGATETCEIGKASGNSNLGHLPIFSVLVPQPCPTDAAQSVDTARSDDVELLFEYFESDQPQQRRPLYEKIQELAKGGVLSRCKMYGDPSSLVSVNVHDLHPRSWYSVAWYPIYRIPDGNLRAAFLTYHSLGHLLHSSVKSDSTGVGVSFVYPVVGLQSYNAQSECWFQLQHGSGTETAGSPSLNTSGILKERLRTLEETASLMARATVNKGDQISVNKHPDYEFFLSRRG